MLHKFRKYLVLGCVVLALSGCNPFKVTDPKNPAFDLSDFALKNYQTSENLLASLEVLIPVRSKKDQVEKILINQAHAFGTLPFHMPKPAKYNDGPDANGYIIAYYAADRIKRKPGYINNPGWEVWVYYNLQDEVTKIETKRIEFKPSTIQMLLLVKNPVNSERAK